MKRAMAITHVLLVALLMSSSVQADDLLDYGTYAGYGIKKGILGHDYATPLAACIGGTISTLPASRAAVRVSIVSNASEYKQAFHIDQKAEASFLGLFGANEELHFGQENTGKFSAFDIIVEAYGEHDGQTVDNISWDAPYAEMMASGDPSRKQQVRQNCGDRYIQSVFYETRLFIVLHVSNSQTSTLSTFRGSAGGHIGLDIASASASLGGDRNVSQANRSGAISLDMYSEGLGGVVPTAGAVGIVAPSDDGLQAIGTKLAAYLSTLRDTGQPVKYRLAPLPGMAGGDLADDRILQYLLGLKMTHQANGVRLANVTSLLSPADPRRIFLRQPAADQLLGQVLASVTAYDNGVIGAHDGCRKAFTMGVCTSLLTSVQAPPPRPTVELIPAVTPQLGPFTFAIDGAPVQPGQTTVFLSGGATTLLAAARVINPGASNVDLLAPIYGDPYLSLLQMTTTFDPLSFPSLKRREPLVYQLWAQTLSWPRYWQIPDQDSFALWVVHADAQHPCRIVRRTPAGETWPSVRDLYSFEDDCLTAAGHQLKDAALVQTAAFMAGNVQALGFASNVGFSTTNCMGQTWGLSAATLLVSGRTNTADASLLLSPNGYGPLALFSEAETHDRPTWAEVFQTRVSRAGSNSSPSGNPCSPRFP